MTVLVFRVAVFLGAYLLFLIQPLSAKQILPWFGGGPAVWSTTLLFFQTALVAGYAYAHVTRRLGVSRQAAVHVGLLALAVITLSVLPAADWKPPDGEAPASRVLTVLGAHVGFPFVLLAATAPLLQDWRARLLPDRSPYRLYALSNIGSLVALLSFPFLFEPWLSIDAQAGWWSVAFVLFVLSCGWCAWLVVRRAAPEDSAGPGDQEAAGSVSTVDQALWLGLPAVGAGLLLATTSELTQNVAAIPLLWVVPLTLYLATYIAAFADWYSRSLWCWLFVPALVGAVSILRGAAFGSLPVQATVLLAVLVAGCMVCHGEVARRRPAASRLTEYYLALAIGGGLGGAFVAVVAPVIFDTFIELRVLYLLTTAIVATALYRHLTATRRRRPSRPLIALLGTGVVVVGVVVLVRGDDPLRVLATSRNFYGVATVAEDPPGTPLAVRRLYHGQILHGMQFVEPSMARRATAYYVEGSGLELAMRQHPRRDQGLPLTVGVVGLGIGTVAVWGEPGDHIRFFEIDPDVAALAQQYFTFLRDSPADVDLVMGDGRLSLERELAQNGSDRYDLLVLDAFSGDALPVHLLTREAFVLYDRVLKRDGLLTVNFSNRYLDLRPVIRGLSVERGLELRVVARDADRAQRENPSNWAIATRNLTFLARYPRRSSDTRTMVWTDAYSSLLGVIQ